MTLTGNNKRRDEGIVTFCRYDLEYNGSLQGNIVEWNGVNYVRSLGVTQVRGYNHTKAMCSNQEADGNIELLSSLMVMRGTACTSGGQGRTRIHMGLGGRTLRAFTLHVLS